MSEVELLELAVRIERRVATIYRRFYAFFHEDQMSGYLWHTLALEEDGHADFIEAELKMIKTVPQAFGDVKCDIEPLNKTLEKLDAIEKRILEEELTMKDAISIALDIEQEMVEKKYSDLIDVSSKPLKKIFEQLTEGTDHLEKIALVAKKLGIE